MPTKWSTKTETTSLDINTLTSTIKNTDALGTIAKYNTRDEFINYLNTLPLTTKTALLCSIYTWTMSSKNYDNTKLKKELLSVASLTLTSNPVYLYSSKEVWQHLHDYAIGKSTRTKTVCTDAANMIMQIAKRCGIPCVVGTNGIHSVPILMLGKDAVIPEPGMVVVGTYKSDKDLCFLVQLANAAAAQYVPKEAKSGMFNPFVVRVGGKTYLTPLARFLEKNGIGPMWRGPTPQIQHSQKNGVAVDVEANADFQSVMAKANKADWVVYGFLSQTKHGLSSMKSYGGGVEHIFGNDNKHVKIGAMVGNNNITIGKDINIIPLENLDLKRSINLVSAALYADALWKYPMLHKKLKGLDVGITLLNHLSYVLSTSPTFNAGQTVMMAFKNPKGKITVFGGYNLTPGYPQQDKTTHMRDLMTKPALNKIVGVSTTFNLNPKMSLDLNYSHRFGQSLSTTISTKLHDQITKKWGVDVGLTQTSQNKTLPDTTVYLGLSCKF